MIDNFFRLNMPYGIERNEKGEWIAFNREYNPLGTKGHGTMRHHPDKWYKYKETLSEKTLLSFASEDKDAVQYDKSGRIYRVFFYNQSTNPSNRTATREHWDAYMDKLYILAKWKLA